MYAGGGADLAHLLVVLADALAPLHAAPHARDEVQHGAGEPDHRTRDVERRLVRLGRVVHGTWGDKKCCIYFHRDLLLDIWQHHSHCR